MSRPLRRLSVAATSALSITALTFGLAAPAGAVPATQLDDPAAVAAAAADLSGRRISDLVPGLVDDVIAQQPDQRFSARAADADTATLTPAVEEADRTDKSVTLRFTLPNGAVTRDGAVLQAFSEAIGFRVSLLSWLTDPAVDLGADHSDAYSHQLTSLRVADLVRENFTVSGATATTSALQDHFAVPAGRNSFDITVTSARSQDELSGALQTITGAPAEESEWMASYLFATRLELPSAGGEFEWAYGEPLPLIRTHAAPKYPNGANELIQDRTGNSYASTTTVSRVDGAPFSGDRVLRFQTGLDMLTDIPFYGELAEILQSAAAPPLRVGPLTTEVVGATHLRDGFYLPDAGVDTITARTVGTGPATNTEARARFTTWVTETCEADMSEAIPGITLSDGQATITWQEYLDSAVEAYDTEDGSYDESVLYTGPDFIDTVLVEQQKMFANLIAMFPELDGLSSEDLDGLVDSIRAIVPDWDAACGTSDDGVEPDQGQTPASVSLDVPSSAVAGNPLTLSARVTDSAGDPVSGQQVTFTVSESGAGTLRMAAAGDRVAITADGPTILTAITGADGVATVEYTPTGSGTLRVSASTGGANPVTSDSDSTITVTPAPGGGDDDGPGDADGDDDAPASSGSLGSLGSLFGSLGS